MIVSGHQPVYLPWLGLFHKLALCDTFVYMDTVQYLENDWNNRNRVRTPQGWSWLSVPIDRKQSSGPLLPQIIIRGHDNPTGRDFWQTQHWSTLKVNYSKAPFFREYSDRLEALYTEQIWVRLVDLCWAQFELFRELLGFADTRVVRMSESHFEGSKDDLVLDHCLKLGASAVVFGTQGRNYVDLSKFTDRQIRVYFQSYQHPTYTQRFPGFEPYMTVADLLFNHGPGSREILLSNNVTKATLQSGALWEV